jgi:hypothetical protein
MRHLVTKLREATRSIADAYQWDGQKQMGLAKSYALPPHPGEAIRFRVGSPPKAADYFNAGLDGNGNPDPRLQRPTP